MAASRSFAGRYVFVAGLHRTGTSLVARLLAHSPEIASIQGSPAPENEGCYLQGAIPHTAMHGIPGHFATDPAQHLIEGCTFDTKQSRDRLSTDWDRWFGPEETQWRMEKSPVNLTRTRLYQQLFPMAQFIVVLRHPSAMAAALAKWVDTPPGVLVDYALDAYDQMETDLAYLHAALVVRYEDLITAPEEVLGAMFRFLDLACPNMQDFTARLRDGNADYPDAVPLSSAQLARAGRWGYRQGLMVDPIAPIVKHPLRAVRDATTEALSSGT